MQNAKHLANQSEFTFASFISPSGNGLKILVKINSDKANHKEAFLLVQAHYESILKLEIDKSGKDLTRLCFYSYDENLYYNENAKIFSTTEQEKEPKANIEREFKKQSQQLLLIAMQFITIA